MKASKFNSVTSKGTTAEFMKKLITMPVAFRNQALELSDIFLHAIKENSILTATVASTILVPGAILGGPTIFQAVLTSLHAIEQKITIQDLDLKQQEIINHFLDKTPELLAYAGGSISSSQPDTKVKKLLKANSFTALRSLNGNGKGRLLRFLFENELIKASGTTISLSGADLREIDLQDAWLPEINLSGTYMLHGNLKNVNLKRANLAGAHLTNTDLQGANLQSANLQSANLQSADLSNTQLTGAKYNSQTVFPDKFDPGKARMRLEE